MQAGQFECKFNKKWLEDHKYAVGCNHLAIRMRRDVNFVAKHSNLEQWVVKHWILMKSEKHERYANTQKSTMPIESFTATASLAV